MSHRDCRTVVYMQCCSSHELTIRALQYVADFILTYLFIVLETGHLTKGMFTSIFDVFVRSF
jgi:hypothetical protein